MELSLRSVVLVVVTALSPATVLAQACAGIEQRVNDRSRALEGTVMDAIDSQESALVVQEEAERADLLSALHVLTAQLAGSSSQEVAAAEAAARSLAQVLVEESMAEQARTAIRDFGDMGHDPCGLVEEGYAVEAALAGAVEARTRLQEAVAVRHAAREHEEHRAMLAEHASLEEEWGELTAEVLFSGTEEEVEAFVRVALGPPRPPVAPSFGEDAAAADRVAALTHLARQSVGAAVLTDVATSERVDEALRAMADRWVGPDGQAEVWAARQATSGPRAALLDTARIEAANLSIAANGLVRDLMEEFALATFALAHAERRR